MKLLKHIIILISIGCFRCASIQKPQHNSSLEIGQISYTEQQSNTAVDSIYVKVISNPENINLDSILFRGKTTKLVLKNENLYVGTFPKKDFIMSDVPYAEHANELPELPQKQSFNLKDDEAIVYYGLKSQTLHFKASGIIKR